PTAMPEVATRVLGRAAQRDFHTGARAAWMALCSGFSLYPQPSRMSSTVGFLPVVIRSLSVPGFEECECYRLGGAKAIEPAVSRRPCAIRVRALGYTCRR